MSDRKLDEINRQIADLERQRAELQDPKRKEVRELYGELDRILNRLAELGEDVSNHDGEAVALIGTRFRYTHGLPLRERLPLKER